MGTIISSHVSHVFTETISHPHCVMSEPVLSVTPIQDSTRRRTADGLMAEIKGIEPLEFANLDRASTLVIDVRPITSYAGGHIDGAISICIPSTLLKRQTFGYSRIIELVAPQESAKLRRIPEYEAVVFYDSSSIKLRSDTPLARTLQKFMNVVDEKHLFFLSGGISALSSIAPGRVVTSVEHHPKSPFNLLPVTTEVRGILGSTPLSSRSPFFSSDESTTINAPEHVDIDRLPPWLKYALSESREGHDFVAEEFSQLQASEMSRIQNSLFTGDPGKNRYSNVHPYSHNRVLAGDKYVNASYIQSHLVPRHRYIATQAPVPASFSDFWRLILEHRVPLILMLTTLFTESGAVKGHKYWNSGTYGDIYLETLETYREDDFVTRKIRVSNKEGNVHELLHIHYEQWPDLGTPNNIQELLRLVELKQRLVRDDSQVVVHCSAGCGRTGTFCTIDTVVAFLREQAPDQQRQDHVDHVFETVREFRNQRVFMVQNQRQLQLCYDAIIAWLGNR